MLGCTEVLGLPDWELELHENSIQYIFGYAIALGTRVSSCAESESVSISTDIKGRKLRYVFSLDENGWKPRGIEPTALVQRVSVQDSSSVFLHDKRVTRGLRLADGTSSRAFASKLNRALELIHKASPQCAHWLKGVIRALVLVDLPGGMTSSSSEDILGVVCMAMPHSEEQLAVQLVHEASHQYYMALDRVFPLSIASPERVYSPLAGCPRPPGRVLLALHAAANMGVFISQLDAFAPGCRYLAEARARFIEPSRSTAKELRLTSSLTTAGEELLREIESLLWGHPAFD